MSEDKELKELYSNVNSILKKINVKDIDPEKDFDKNPDGYYLTEVVSLEVCTSKKSGNLQVAGQFKIVENGIGVNVDDDGEQDFFELKNTKGKTIFKYYPMTDESQVTKLIKDMLKFTDEDGKSILDEEYFSDIEIMKEALSILTEERIYIHLYSYTNKTTKETNQNSNLITWKRASDIGLID